MNVETAETPVNTMIVAYIAHPIGGNVVGNLGRIREIVRDINLNEANVVPFVPYYVDCLALDDHIPAERKRGLRNGAALLRSGVVNELWLYGNKISNGMVHEIVIAKTKGIVIVPKTPETKYQYEQHFKDVKPASNGQ